jgi:hypothetical protein
MRKLILTAPMLAMVGVSPGFARGGLDYSGNSLSSPANPSVPPSHAGCAPYRKRAAAVLAPAIDESRRVLADTARSRGREGQQDDQEHLQRLLTRLARFERCMHG